MVDWCLYGEALDKNGNSFSMAPNIVIVNVPEKISLNRRSFFHFLKNKVTEKDLAMLKGIKTSQGYRLNLISLAGEIPQELKRGFDAFGIGALVGFYDWLESTERYQIGMEFAGRHPDLIDILKDYPFKINELNETFVRCEKNEIIEIK